jgi:DNA-binding MarR family transcriptional regulator
VLRTLERRELVRRSPDPADARVKRLTVTEAGHRLALETVAVVEAADAAFFARAGSPRQVLEVLSKLAAPEEGSR